MSTDMQNRRSLILGAAFGVAAPALVRAESLLSLPGDPLTARGLMAASKWATEEFQEHPGCRLVFADGQTTRWSIYQHMSRPAMATTKDAPRRTFAVAIETVVTDANGHRFITSVPIDAEAIAEQDARRAEQWASRFSRFTDDFD